MKINFVTEELLKKYIPLTVGMKEDEAFEKAFPVMALLYSLPLEMLHSILKSIKEDLNMREIYAGLAHADNSPAGNLRSKELFKKILDKMK